MDKTKKSSTFNIKCGSDVKNRILNVLKKKRKPNKGKRFYKLIINAYDVFPETIKQLIPEIGRINYYKDYINILELSDNINLDMYIYNLINIQLNKDLEHYYSEEYDQLSMLAKWLPREKSKYDKKLNFVKKITAIMFKDEKKFTAYRKYRQIVANLNKKLDTIEIKLCAKQFDDINFETITHSNLRKYFRIFLKHDETKDKLYEYLYKKYNDMDLINIIRMIRYTNVDKMKDLDKDIIQKMFDIKKKDANNSEFQIYMDNEKNKLLVIDLSMDLFYNNSIYTVLLHSLAYLDTHEELYLNANNPKKIIIPLNLNIFEKIKLIINNLVSYKIIRIDRLIEKYDLDDKHIYVITNKQFIENTTLNLKNNILNYHYLINNNNVNISTENNRTIVTGDIHYSRNKQVNNQYIIIKKLLNNSNELVTYKIFGRHFKAGNVYKTALCTLPIIYMAGISFMDRVYEYIDENYVTFGC